MLVVPKIRAKFYCADCKSWFDSPISKEWEEPREFWGMTCFEHFIEYRCPECNSDDVWDSYNLIEDDEMEE
jgi:Zn finger protein HypA/HybF involved in hydrogenase expression